MLETAIALALGHLAADFLLQTDAMVERKGTVLGLALHLAVVAAATWASLGFAPAGWLLLFIVASHSLFDIIKLRLGGKGFTSFIADQAAHLVSILVGAGLFSEAFRSGVWGWAWPASLAPWQPFVPEAMAVAGGAILTVWAGGYAVQSILDGAAPPIGADADTAFPTGGRLIGRLERAMILILVLSGQTAAIGFLIAAKVLRFNQIGPAPDVRISEYVTVGTLASFAWGLGSAFGTSAVIALLRTP